MIHTSEDKLLRAKKVVATKGSFGKTGESSEVKAYAQALQTLGKDAKKEDLINEVYKILGGGYITEEIAQRNVEIKKRFEERKKEKKSKSKFVEEDED